MAPSLPSSQEGDEGLPTEELVFSCSICQATPSEVYATKESNNGFHSGISGDEGIVTRMWISSCSHITCAKHLQGGVPFHPKGRPPKATCPRCAKDQGDDSPRELYSIRGVLKGEYDPVIPDEWFRCPPIKLDTDMPGISALRFQYVAISHYARQARKHWKSTQRKLSELETAYSHERKARRQCQGEVQGLKGRIETLEQSEAKLKKWEARKALINHYMGQVGGMADEIKSLRGQLRELGYRVPEHSYTLHSDRSHGTTHQSEQEHRPSDTDKPSWSGRVAPTVPGRPRDLNPVVSTSVIDESSSSARKRKRERGDEGIAGYEQRDSQQRGQRGSSRDLMPPPLPRPKPLSPSRNAPINTATTAPPRSIGHYVRPDGLIDVRPDRRYDTPRVPWEPPVSGMNSPLASHPAPISRTTPDRVLQGSMNNNHDAAKNYDITRRSDLVQTTTERRLLLRSRHGVVQSMTGQLINAREHQMYRQSWEEPYEAPHLALHNHSQLPWNRSAKGRPQPLQTTPSPPKQRVTTATSPLFLHRPSEPQPPTLQRPPTRGSFTQTNYTETRNNANSFQMAHVRGEIPNGSDVQMSLNGLSFIDRPHRQYDHQPLYEVPTRPSIYDKPLLHQPLRASGERRILQSYLHRPGIHEVEGQYSPYRQRGDAQQGRISLPPGSRQSGHIGGLPDIALSQIHGVRGISSQRGSHSQSGYGVVRRSVRR